METNNCYHRECKLLVVSYALSPSMIIIHVVILRINKKNLYSTRYSRMKSLLFFFSVSFKISYIILKQQRANSTEFGRGGGSCTRIVELIILRLPLLNENDKWTDIYICICIVYLCLTYSLKLCVLQ